MTGKYTNSIDLVDRDGVEPPPAFSDLVQSELGGAAAMTGSRDLRRALEIKLAVGSKALKDKRYVAAVEGGIQALNQRDIVAHGNLREFAARLLNLT
jgi:hypothetical protein